MRHRSRAVVLAIAFLGVLGTSTVTPALAGDSSDDVAVIRLPRDATGDEPRAGIESTRRFGNIYTFAGTGAAGPGEENVDPLLSSLYFPSDVTIGPDGLVYIVDWNNHKIRVVENGLVRTFVGSGFLGDATPGPALEIGLNHPNHVAFDPAGDLIIAAWHNSKILRMDMTTGLVDVYCSTTGNRGFAGDGGPCIDAVFNLPSSTGFDPQGRMYISDQANFRIRMVDLDDVINTIVGTGVRAFCGDGGPAIEACLSNPAGQAAWPAGRILFDGAGDLHIADTGNNRVRKVDHTSGIITTIAGVGTPGFSGDGGPAIEAELREPADLAFDSDGNLYIADSYNNCVRMIDQDGMISTVAGIGGAENGGRSDDGGPATESKLDRPFGIDLDGDGNLYIADTFTHRIRLVRVLSPIAVHLDIMPGSCPGSLNARTSANENADPRSMAGGALPVAILGTSELDVTEIDVSSLRLEGVPPAKHGYEDVATPGESNRACACSTEGPDGGIDLKLKFKRSEIVAALGAVRDREIRSLTLTGQLLDGTPFEASDCVRILADEPELPPGRSNEEEATLGAASPNPFNPVTTIRYALPRDGEVTLSVYDVRGRLVERLVEGFQPAGEYSVRWEARGVASGIYFYRLRTAGTVKTRRMILLK